MSDFSHTIPLLAAALTAILAGCATTSAPSADSAGCEVPPAADEAECEVPPDTDEAGGQVVADSAAGLATKPDNGLPPLRVGVYVDGGASGVGAIEWLRSVNDSPDMELRLITGRNVREGALGEIDVFVMPGGNSKTEYRTLGTNGVERMKDFIREGGAYIGTCAGCCLLMDGPVERARLMPWNTTGSERSTIMLTVKVNDAGSKALGITKGDHVMRYHGGPFLWPTTNRIDGADFAVWGTYNAEAACAGRVPTKGKMYGAAAMVGGTYGKGKVFVTALHPEYFDSTRYIVAGAFEWLTGRKVTFPVRQKKLGALSVGVMQGGGIEGVKTTLAINSADDMDMVPVNANTILQGALEHIDVLVACGTTNSKRALQAIREFSARGGRIVALSTAAAILPKGSGKAYPNADKLMAALRQIK